MHPANQCIEKHKRRYREEGHPLVRPVSRANVEDPGDRDKWYAHRETNGIRWNQRETDRFTHGDDFGRGERQRSVRQQAQDCEGPEPAP